MPRNLPFLCFFAASACTGGAVNLEGAGPFVVQSAVWLDVVAPADGAHRHHLVWSEQADFCAQYQAGAALLTALEADLDSGDLRMCDANDRLSEVSAAFGPLVAAGARELDFALASSPEVGSYRTADADGEDVGAEFSGWLTLHLGDGYDAVATSGDCEDPDGIWASVDTLGVGEESTKVDPGALEITHVDGGFIEATATGTLRILEDGGDGKAAGDLTASGTFAYCEASGFYDLFRAATPALTTETFEEEEDEE